MTEEKKEHPGQGGSWGSLCTSKVWSPHLTMGAQGVSLRQPLLIPQGSSSPSGTCTLGPQALAHESPFPAPFHLPCELDVVFLAGRSGLPVTLASKLATPFCYFPPLGPDHTTLALCLPIAACHMIPKHDRDRVTVPSTWQKAAIQSVSTARVTSVQ